jgi:serine/threonine-protein kinase
MSPEQASGELEIDGRSDIYSLGCVLYEMIAGRQPFTGPSAAAVIAKRFFETPSPLRTIDGAIPLALEQLVSHTMARDPVDRYATAEIMLDALASIGGSIGRVHVSSPDDKPSIAVLPFTNTSGDTDDEYFSDGMTEEVISALAHLPGLRVAARTSSFVFKGERADLRSIAEQLSVKTILEGSVRRAGSKVRISVQLIGAGDGLHLWSERYDGDLADVFAVQDRIAQSIASALRQHLGTKDGDASNAGGRTLVRERAPVNPAAYDVFLRGRFLFEQHKALEALACFERAAEIDPAFARARAWIALGNILSANLAMLPALVAYPRARAATEHALSIDPDLVEARFSRGLIAAWFDWDRDRAEALARDLVALAPDMTYAHELLGWTLSTAERFEEGIGSMAHAYELDSLSDFMLYNFAMGLILAGEVSRALDELERGLTRSPGNASAHELEGLAFFALDQLADANSAFERSRELSPQRHMSARHACVLAAMGRADEARTLVGDAEVRVVRGTGGAFDIGCAYHWLGDDTAAFEWLERSFQAREFCMTWLHLEPRLRRLHGDPRFESLVRRVGVAPRASVQAG